MTDIRQPDPIDWTNYDDGGSGKELPPKGDYTILISGIEQDRTNEGYLQAIVEAKVVDPGKPWDGYLTRYNRFSTKKWPNRNANPLADYLRGFGAKGPFLTDADYINAMQATLNQQAVGHLDWELYDSASGERIRGMENFPTGPDGKKLTMVTRGENKLYANVRVRYIKTQR